MALCVIQNGDGLLQVTATAPGSCTDYILQSASEIAVNTPSITIDDAVQMSVAVVSVWLAVWAIKILRRAI